MVKNPPVNRKPGFDPWIRKIPWRRECQPTAVLPPGKFHGQEPGGLQSMGVTKNWTQLSS